MKVLVCIYFVPIEGTRFVELYNRCNSKNSQYICDIWNYLHGDILSTKLIELIPRYPTNYAILNVHYLHSINLNNL